jgi:hypothetical protein
MDLEPIRVKISKFYDDLINRLIGELLKLTREQVQEIASGDDDQLVRIREIQALSKQALVVHPTNGLPDENGQRCKDQMILANAALGRKHLIVQIWEIGQTDRVKAKQMLTEDGRPLISGLILRFHPKQTASEQ